jgi:hypothetical protein
MSGKTAHGTIATPDRKIRPIAKSQARACWSSLTSMLSQRADGLAAAIVEKIT